MVSTIRVLVVDDNRDIREMLGMLIDVEADMSCAALLSSADTLLDSIIEHEAHVVLLDLKMAGKDPLEALSEATQTCPNTKTIVLSGYDDPETIHEASERGAWGFICKDVEPDTVISTIRRVYNGEFVVLR